MNDLSEYMDRYFSNGMTPEERKLFDNKIISDEIFAKEVAMYITLHEHFKDQWYQRRKQEFTALAKEDTSLLNNEHGNEDDELAFQEKKTERSNPEAEIQAKGVIASFSEDRAMEQRGGKKDAPKLIFKIAIAAAILGVIAVSVIWYSQGERKKNTLIADNQRRAETTVPVIQPDTSTPKFVTKEGETKTNEESTSARTLTEANSEIVSATKRKKLFEENFKPDLVPEDKEGPLEDAYNQYEQKQYQNAIARFEHVNLNSDNRSEAIDTSLIRLYASYYKALSYMAINDEITAIAELKKIATPEPLLQVKVKWYMALAYLKQGNIRESLSLLQEINSNSKASYFKLKAYKLITKLKNNNSLY